MEGRIKGQFFIVAGFVIGMYLFFLSQIMTNIQLNGEIPQEEVPLEEILSAVQQMADEGDLNFESRISLLYDTLSNIPESVSLVCDGGCERPFADWACGIQVTAQYTEKSVSSKSSFIQSRYDFKYDSPRKAIKFVSNESGKLINVSFVPQPDFVNPAVLVHRGEVVPANWSGLVSLRINMVKDTPEIVYIYNTTGSSSRVFSDIGVLNDSIWDGSELISALQPNWDTEAMTVSDLESLYSKPQAGPRVIMIPELGYPYSSLSALKEYMKKGGILAVVGGLCHGYCSGTPWYECNTDCELAEEETVTDSHWLAAKSPFNESWDPVKDFNSTLFAKTSLVWFVYKSQSGENLNRSAVGAVRYGEGYLVYVGNETWFDPNWGNFTESMNTFLNWAIGHPGISSSTCPTQGPTGS